MANATVTPFHAFFLHMSDAPFPAAAIHALSHTLSIPTVLATNAEAVKFPLSFFKTSAEKD